MLGPRPRAAGTTRPRVGAAAYPRAVGRAHALPGPHALAPSGLRTSATKAAGAWQGKMSTEAALPRGVGGLPTRAGGRRADRERAHARLGRAPRRADGPLGRHAAEGAAGSRRAACARTGPVLSAPPPAVRAPGSARRVAVVGRRAPMKGPRHRWPRPRPQGCWGRSRRAQAAPWPDPVPSRMPRHRQWPPGLGRSKHHGGGCKKVGAVRVFNTLNTAPDRLDAWTVWAVPGLARPPGHMSDSLNLLIIFCKFNYKTL